MQLTEADVGACSVLEEWGEERLHDSKQILSPHLCVLGCRYGARGPCVTYTELSPLPALPLPPCPAPSWPIYLKSP